MRLRVGIMMMIKQEHQLLMMNDERHNMSEEISFLTRFDYLVVFEKMKMFVFELEHLHLVNIELEKKDFRIKNFD
jgi:hypothetical protein